MLLVLLSDDISRSRRDKSVILSVKKRKTTMILPRRDKSVLGNELYT